MMRAIIAFLLLSGLISFASAIGFIQADAQVAVYPAQQISVERLDASSTPTADPTIFTTPGVIGPRSPVTEADFDNDRTIVLPQPPSTVGWLDIDGDGISEIWFEFQPSEEFSESDLRYFIGGADSFVIAYDITTDRSFQAARCQVFGRTSVDAVRACSRRVDSISAESELSNLTDYYRAMRENSELPLFSSANPVPPLQNFDNAFLWSRNSLHQIEWAMANQYLAQSRNDYSANGDNEMSQRRLTFALERRADAASSPFLVE